MANVTSRSLWDRLRARWALWLVLAAAVLLWVGFGISIIQVTIDRNSIPPLAFWGMTIIIMFGLLALAGREINGQWFGVLIDSRNKISLSRLQITLWTVLVLSAYLTIALPRVWAMVVAAPTPAAAQAPGVAPTPTATPTPGAAQAAPKTAPTPEDASTSEVAKAMDIRFPQELIVAMGISAASFTGSSLIMSNKKGKQIKVDARLSPDAAQTRRDQAADALKKAEAALLDAVKTEDTRKVNLEQAKTALTAGTATQAKVDMDETLYSAALIDKEAATKDRDAKKAALETSESELADILATQGLLHKNADPSEARWVDLFRGEEIGNFKLVDMSKVQMLFFTVVIIAAYAAAISGLLRDLTVLRTSAFIAFPGFSESLNFLLGISHGTYLSVKTIDQS